MKKLKRFLCLLLAILTVFAFVACGSDNSDSSDDSGTAKDIDSKVSDTEKEIDTNTDNVSDNVEIASDIKAAIEASNHLTGAHFFLADDGTIYTLADKSDKGFADVYAKLPNVKKLSLSNVGSAVFALTDNGDLYYKEDKVATDVKDISYCTTNSNVEGYCIVGNDIMWITSYEAIYEVPKTDEFKNVITGENASGNFVSIEVDKHDFVVLNDKGDVFLNIGGSSEAYEELDFSNFKNMALVDIAKLTGNDIGNSGGDIEALTVAGLKGDGTVVATGTHAEEILKWGKLSYLTMSEGMIVGLTADGKLKMTGEYAEKMKPIVDSWSDIVAVEAGYANVNFTDRILTAMDASGNFYYVSLFNIKADAENGMISADNVTGEKYCWKYTTDGKIYQYCYPYEAEWIDITDEE